MRISTFRKIQEFLQSHFVALNHTHEFFIWLLAYSAAFSNAMVEICTGFVIFIFLLKRSVRQDYRAPQTSLNKLVYLFLAIVFVSFLRSEHFGNSLKGFMRIPKYLFLYFALVDFFVADAKRLRRFFWLMTGVSCFIFLNGIFQHFFGFDILRHRELINLDYQRRLMASFVHPNDFGAYIITILPLSFAFLSKELSKKQRAFLLAVSLLGLYCLIRTSSRSAWLGFIFAVSIYAFYLRRRFALFVPVILLGLIAVSPNGFERITSLFARDENTVWERLQLWRGTWEMVKEHPFLGFGINTFSEYYPQYRPPDYQDIRYTHNCYLQMWSEIGIVGLVSFCLIPFWTLKKTWYRLREKIQSDLEGYMLLGLVCGYIAFLIQAGLDTNFYSLLLRTLFWIFTASIVSLNQHIEGRLCPKNIP